MARVDGTIGCTTSKGDMNWSCPSVGNGECWCESCWEARDDRCAHCGFGCEECCGGTYKKTWPKTKYYECCGQGGRGGKWDDLMCPECYDNLKPVEHVSKICEHCEAETCEHADAACCAASTLATKEQLARFHVEEKARKKREEEIRKQEEEEAKRREAAKIYLKDQSPKLESDIKHLTEIVLPMLKSESVRAEITALVQSPPDVCKHSSDSIREEIETLREECVYEKENKEREAKRLKRCDGGGAAIAQSM